MIEGEGCSVLAQAREAFKERRYEEAIRLLTELRRESEQDDPEVLTLLGAAHGENKDYYQALAYFEKAVSLQPTARGYFNVATLYQLQKDNDPAVRALKSALKLDPTYERASRLLEEIEGPTEPIAQPHPARVPAAASAPARAPVPTPAAAPPAATAQTTVATQQAAPQPPPAASPKLVENRNWGKVIGGGILVGLPFLLIWGAWTFRLSLFGAPVIVSAVVSLALLALLTKWLADNAGAYEIQHWVAMIILTGLIPSLVMMKGFDLLAQGWYNMERRG